MAPRRWHQRFENYDAALLLLGEAMQAAERGTLSMLEREGTIQRFEYCWELAWKSMRDYLRDNGIALDTPVPANVIRAAFQVELITDGDGWMAARDARNLLSHEYSRPMFDAIFHDVQARYFPLMIALRDKLASERDAGN